MKPRALALVSGGLDSRLALTATRRAGWSVQPVHFDTGFVKPARAAWLPPDTERVVVFADYLRTVLDAPRHGFGAAMNPCLDCRIFMLRSAGDLARRLGIDWLVTGDVIGQRAIDQSRHALRQIDDEAGVAGRMLRPLSAELLAGHGLSRPLPRGEGGAGEGRLHGRGRRAQRELARQWEVEAGPTPSGGCCLLAEPRFAGRLRDLLEHAHRGAVGRADVERLRVGRHFRIGWDLKLVVARNAAEGNRLLAAPGDGWLAQAAGGSGPWAWVDGDPGGERGREAAAVLLRYAGRAAGERGAVRFLRGDARRSVEAVAASHAEVDRLRVGVL